VWIKGARRVACSRWRSIDTRPSPKEAAVRPKRPTGASPDAQPDYAERALAGLPEESVATVLHDNAARVYHLD